MRTLLAVLLAACIAAPAAAADDNLVRKASAHTVATTMDRLAAIVETKGAKVFARIDHAKGAAAVGATLRPTETLIFGNPKIGTPIMEMSQEAGLDLPLRALAYEDATGKVWLVYRKPAAMAAAHGLDGDAPAFKPMTMAINGLTDAATAK